MRLVFIDTETRGPIDLKRAGGIRYSYDAELLSVQWADESRLGFAGLRHWDIIANGPYSTPLQAEPDTVYVAHNAQFDRHIMSMLSDEEFLPPERWVCTAAMSRFCGLPGGLDKAGRAIGLPDELTKMDDSGGIKAFCCPPYVDPRADPDKWAKFMHYADRDTVTCRALYARLVQFMTDHGQRQKWFSYERHVFNMDQRINDRGFHVDRAVITSAQAMVEELRPLLNAELLVLTDGRVRTVNAHKALKLWLIDKGHDVPGTDKHVVAGLLARYDLKDDVRRALTLRQQGAKSSMAKYTSMLETICEDDRVRGCFLYYGAHTGRWSGKQVQPQNLAKPQDGLDPVEVAGHIAAADGDLSMLSMLYDQDTFTVLQAGIRGAITAPKGRTLVIVDYAQIEARITAWYAECERLLEAFRNDEDVYTLTAREALGSEDRQAGKVIMLGCGFGMGHKKFAAINGMDEAVAEQWVSAWRAAFHEIPMLWYRLGAGLQWHGQCSDRQGLLGWRNFTGRNTPGSLDDVRSVEWHRPPGSHCTGMKMASGRKLFYPDARTLTWGEWHDGMKKADRTPSDRTLEIMARHEKNDICGQSVFTSHHGHQKDIWGGVVTENLVQGTARDVMVGHMLKMDKDGVEIIAHSHDEIIAECDEADAPRTLAYMLDVMQQPVSYLPGCPIKGEGGISKRYTKL